MPHKYAAVAPGTPYNRPAFPGALVISPNTTNVQAQMLHDQHNKNLRVFRKTEAVHNALIQQVVKSSKPMYLKTLRNLVTQTFLLLLNEILQHLITVYGKLNPKTLMTRKNELEFL